MVGCEEIYYPAQLVGREPLEPHFYAFLTIFKQLQLRDSHLIISHDKSFAIKSETLRQIMNEPQRSNYVDRKTT